MNCCRSRSRGQEPEGDHRGEVDGRIAAQTPKAGGSSRRRSRAHILEDAALHGRRNRAGGLDIFDHASTSARASEIVFPISIVTERARSSRRLSSPPQREQLARPRDHRYVRATGRARTAACTRHRDPSRSRAVPCPAPRRVRGWSRRAARTRGGVHAPPIVLSSTRVEIRDGHHVETIAAAECRRDHEGRPARGLGSRAGARCLRRRVRSAGPRPRRRRCPPR